MTSYDHLPLIFSCPGCASYTLGWRCPGFGPGTSWFKGECSTVVLTELPSRDLDRVVIWELDLKIPDWFGFGIVLDYLCM